MARDELDETESRETLESVDSILRAVVVTPPLVPIRELESGTIVDDQYRIERVLGP